MKTEKLYTVIQVEHCSGIWELYIEEVSERTGEFTGTYDECMEYYLTWRY